NKYYRYTFIQLLNFKFARKIILKPLYKLINKKNIDLIISTHDYLWPYEVDDIKKKKTKICLWFPDPIVNLGKSYFFNCDYDALFFKEPFIVNKIKRLSNIPVFFLPECFNPFAYEIPKNKPKPENDIVTYGSFYSWRNLQLEKFVDYNIKFFGSDPPNWLKSDLKKFHSGYPVFLTDKSNSLLKSKIVLNNLNFGEIQSLSARVFETAGIGAFQIFDYTESVSDIFEEFECVTFKNSQEMKDKVDYYLNNPFERDKIAEAARKKILNKHTYKNRIETLLNVIYENGKGFASKLIDK
ncbi:MAG: glycosyltransferase, partial [Lutibacter sp.]|nr:glycosyltransferase [Lutibacter sp.]